MADTNALLSAIQGRHFRDIPSYQRGLPRRGGIHIAHPGTNRHEDRVSTQETAFHHQRTAKHVSFAPLFNMRTLYIVERIIEINPGQAFLWESTEPLPLFGRITKLQAMLSMVSFDDQAICVGCKVLHSIGVIGGPVLVG